MPLGPGVGAASFQYGLTTPLTSTPLRWVVAPLECLTCCASLSFPFVLALAEPVPPITSDSSLEGGWEGDPDFTVLRYGPASLPCPI
eukprot:10532563-Heterocapsa_arctica.AAC.1